jgi:hypothetical protein
MVDETDENKMSLKYTEDHLDWLDHMMRLVEQASPELVQHGLVDYLEEMSSGQRHAIKSYFVVLILHLLKFKYQPEKATRSWKLSVDDARDELDDIASENKKRFKTVFLEILNNPRLYQKARRKAENETGLLFLPKENPFNWDQLFDQNYYGRD